MSGFGVTLPLELIGYGISQALTPDGNPPLMGPPGNPYTPNTHPNPYAQYTNQLNALQSGSGTAAAATTGMGFDPNAPVRDSGGVLREGQGSPSYYANTNPYAQYASQIAGLLGSAPATPSPQTTPPPLNVHPGAANPYANFDFSRLSYNSNAPDYGSPTAPPPAPPQQPPAQQPPAQQQPAGLLTPPTQGGVLREPWSPYPRTA